MKIVKDIELNVDSLVADLDSGRNEDISLHNEELTAVDKINKSARRQLDDYFEQKSLEDKLLDY